MNAEPEKVGEEKNVPDISAVLKGPEDLKVSQK
jgi:hypothetical protein